MTTNNNFPLLFTRHGWRCFTAKAVGFRWSLRSKLPCIIAAWTLLLCTACPPDTPSKNQPLTANAGTDQTHTLANNLTITLRGTGSTGNNIVYMWECVSYTADQGTVIAEYTTTQVNALIANANTATATASPCKAGTYVFKLTVTDNDGGSNTDTVTVVVEGGTATQQVTAAEVPFSVNEYLDLEVATNNYTFTDPSNIDPAFSLNDLNGITYTLSSTNPDKTAEQLAQRISSGKLNGWTYNDGEYPTITQTFYYNGQEVGSRRFLVVITTGDFLQLRDGDAPETGLLSAIPSTTLNLSKGITEL